MKKAVIIAVSAVLVLAAAFGALCTQITGSCGENLRWFYNPVSKTLTVSGAGDMFNYNDSFPAPWSDKFFRHDYCALVISEGVTSIGDYAFYMCGPDENRTITLPESVSYIGSHAFSASAVEQVVFSEGLVGIDEGAFEFCNLKELDLPDGLKYIGAGAFSHNDKLTTVRIPEGITQLEERLFQVCTQLESIYIPVSVDRIENSVFLSTNASFDHVYYGGTKEQWDEIDIDWYCNYPLESVDFHYETQL